MASSNTFSIPIAPPSASSSSPRHINQALGALASLKNSSQSQFCSTNGAVDPFHSIHSIHMFIRWLESLPVRKYFSSDLLLVAWAVRGLPAGLRSFLEWSLAMEGGIPAKRINLEYLCWQLEMWRSVFSSLKVVEYARQKGKGPNTHITDWYAGSMMYKSMAQDKARRYWDRLSGKKDVPMPDY